MQALQQIIKGVMLVGQLGVTIITPPLVLAWLAHLAQTRLGWGSWVMVTAIVVGLITAFSSAYRMVRQLLADENQEKKPHGRSFNEHL